MDLELFSKYVGKTTPCIKAMVDLAKVIQEQEDVTDDEALFLAQALVSTGIKSLFDKSINLKGAKF